MWTLVCRGGQAAFGIWTKKKKKKQSKENIFLLDKIKIETHSKCHHHWQVWAHYVNDSHGHLCLHVGGEFCPPILSSHLHRFDDSAPLRGIQSQKEHVAFEFHSFICQRWSRRVIALQRWTHADRHTRTCTLTHNRSGNTMTSSTLFSFSSQWRKTICLCTKTNTEFLTWRWVDDCTAR